jgi:putative ABC transport system substrate-binding protein
VALKPRALLWGSLLAGWLVLASSLGCAAPKAPRPVAVEVFEPAPRRGLPVVSVLTPEDAQLLPVIRQLKGELEEEFDVLTTLIDSERDTPEKIGGLIARERPRVVVLLNNSTAKIYRRWARSSGAPPISIILMASFADELSSTIPNSFCIAYEVPAVASFVGLRGLGATVNRVGVVYRKALHRYVDAQRKLAAVERISFVTEELAEGFELRHLRAALVRLKLSEVDVLWLPNDNQLLTRQLVANVWVPYLDRLQLPVVVGVPSLVRGDMAFGTYGAIPDPEALAIQAADLIFEIRDADWASEGQRLRLPVSAKTYVSGPYSERFGVRKARLQNDVDVVVGGSLDER